MTFYNKHAEGMQADGTRPENLYILDPLLVQHHGDAAVPEAVAPELPTKENLNTLMRRKGLVVEVLPEGAIGHPPGGTVIAQMDVTSTQLAKTGILQDVRLVSAEDVDGIAEHKTFVLEVENTNTNEAPGKQEDIAGATTEQLDAPPEIVSPEPVDVNPAIPVLEENRAVEPEPTTEPHCAGVDRSKCIQDAVGVLDEGSTRLPTEGDMAGFARACKDPTLIRHANPDDDDVAMSNPNNDQNSSSGGCSNAPCCKNQLIICKRTTRESVFDGLRGVARWWTDGLTSRWKLLAIVLRLAFSLSLIPFAAGKLVRLLLRDGATGFEYASLALSIVGGITAVVRWVVFGGRRCCEVIKAWRDFIVAAIAICRKMKRCCCRGCQQDAYNAENNPQQPNPLGEQATKATNYVDKMITNRKAFSQPKTTCAGTRAAIGNYTEVVLSATDEVFVTALILTSMYSFAAQNSSTEGVKDWSYVFSLLQILVAVLKMTIFTHISRVFSVALNLYKFDKKLVEDSEVLGLEKTYLCVKPLSFQGRLVFHLVAAALLQLSTLLAVMWKFIQSNCRQTQTTSPDDTPSIVCSPHPVDGFIISVMVYTVVQPILAHVAFFASNARFCVEYLQVIAMRSHLQYEYMSGYTNLPARAARNEYNPIETQFSPRTQFLKILTFDLLPDVSQDAAQCVGRRSYNIRKKIAKELAQDGYNKGNVVCRGLGKIGNSMIFVPSVLFGMAHTILFLLYYAFLLFWGKDLVIPGLGRTINSVYIRSGAVFAFTSFPAPFVAAIWGMFFPLSVFFLECLCGPPGWLKRAVGSAFRWRFGPLT